MAENSDTKEKKKITLGGKKGTLSLKAPLSGGASSRKTLSTGGRSSSKSVSVEVRKKRGAAAAKAQQAATAAEELHLTNTERDARLKALQDAKNSPRAEEPSYQTKLVVKNLSPQDEEKQDKAEAKKSATKDDVRQQEIDALNKINEEEAEKQRKAVASVATLEDDDKKPSTSSAKAKTYAKKPTGSTSEDSTADKKKSKSKNDHSRRNSGKITVYQAINQGDRDPRTRSVAAQKRAREKQRQKQIMANVPKEKVYREVTLPEFITVQELANRMTERVGDIVKKLMEMGVMATSTESIDADTAELLIHEFGHTVKRVQDSDIELGVHTTEDKEEDLQPRPPVVTIMGHVDHGKTSLLDAIRVTNVVKGEAGGITQHIGAYQITTDEDKTITFIDTPGHAAFTDMRARGADVTDIVILVVAANDSVMPQTIEAISHAKAAGKPMIIAINKCDLPEANPEKVRQELLQHEVIVEQMGGEEQCIEVSAMTKQGIKELEEAILMQAEMMNLKANPDRMAIGSVVEAKLEQGKGSVATVLIQKGTLKIGDTFVSGTESGRIRALIDDKGKQVKTATPGQPIEVLGLTGAPEAGDSFMVVNSDAKAREIADYRMRKKRTVAAAQTKSARVLDQMISNIKAGIAENLPVIIKGDVQGSIEAISASLNKITEENNEVKVQILHTGVGAITASDITLARASNALILGFNVRANQQARELAKRDDVEIRYYSIIYEVIDEIKALLSGMLSPELKEKFIGYSEIRQIFMMSKYGKVAGCFITEGIIKRGAKVRLLRDDVVIHEGTLKTLRRFKEEVKEVQKGYECGMAFENYDNIKEGDVIEAFEIESSKRSIDD